MSPSARFPISFILCVLLSSRGPVSAADCPASCTCNDPGKVECTELDDFPSRDSIAGKTFLFFKNCNFETIDEGDLDYPDVETLIIQSSLVQTIADNAFNAMTSLKSLDLTSNELGEMTPLMFAGLDSLDTLFLTNNKLTNIGPTAFNNLPSLKQLALNYNKVVFSENAFANHTALREVDLMNCGLKSVPTAALGKLKQLTKLEFSDNQLEQIPNGTFSAFPDLEILHLDSCHLSQVHQESFKGLNSLTFLDLGNNQLTSIAPGAFDDSKETLRKFYVEVNKLRTLDDQLLEWSVMEQVMFGHNYWECDCGLAFMTDMDLAHKDPENVTCAGPEALKGQLVTNVTDQLCTGEADDGTNMVILGIAIPIVIICVCLIGYYVYKIVQSRRNRENRKSVRYSSVYKDTTEATSKGGHSQPGGGAPTSVL